jgi:hypothetical protein
MQLCIMHLDFLLLSRMSLWQHHSPHCLLLTCK